MTSLETRPSTAKTNDRSHVFHSWSAQGLINPVVIAGGEGSWFWDEDGNRFLDFSSQLVNLNIGHQHPKLVAAIQAQAATLCTVAPSFANDARGEAARLITERAPGDLDMVFFTNGGAEATENAIRMARLHTGKHKVLAAYRSYHGATGGAITMTGDPRRWPSEPGYPGVVHFWGPYPYRSAFHSSSDAEECVRALAHLEDTIMVEGAGTIGAIILETVVGTNGILVPPDGYLAGVRDICDRYGIVMICDEVMCGFGRCGEWFAVDRWGVAPDLICFAKGVNSGYVPLGGVIISRRIADTFDLACDIAEDFGEQLAAEGEICWGGMHSHVVMLDLLERVGRPETLGFQADMAHTLLYTLGYNAPEDAILPTDFKWDSDKKLDDALATLTAALRPWTIDFHVAQNDATVKGSGSHDKTGRHCLPNDPNGKLKIAHHAGYWMRDSYGNVTKKFKHVCWDGCMFPNDVMMKQETWNGILAAMIAVRDAHGWSE